MRVLVVEDNALLRHHLKVQIQDAGHQVDDANELAFSADRQLSMNIYRILRLSISDCQTRTVCH